MLAFQIEVDGERWLLAGVENWKLLMFQLSASRYLPPKEEFTLDVTGVFDLNETSVNNARWTSSPKLSVGSTVIVTLVDTDNPDKPHRCFRYDAEVQESPFTAEEEERMEREEWLRLKAKFGSGEQD